MGKAYIFILSAPSGAGKSTIISKLLDDNSLNIKKTISYTTRLPRLSEKHGVDYNFITESEFKQLIQDNKLLEWAKVHGAFYGTSVEQVQTALENGQCLIKDIDPQGAMILKKRLANKAILIFISPPSIKELEKRLRERNTDSEESIKLRLENAKKEMEYIDKYQFIVINDKLNKAVNKIKNIIKGFCNEN